jgi:zinc-binding in reverse transcriptase
VSLYTLPYISIWRWSVSGIFSVHSFYEWLDFGGIINNEYDIVWKSDIPFKIKKNAWLVRKKKILTNDNLVHRGWDGDTFFAFCGSYEDIDHFFVQCSVAYIL